VKVALPRLLRKVEGETAHCRNTLIALSEIGVRDQVKAEGDQYLELEWAETGESTGVDGRKNRCCTRRWARSGPRWLGAPSVIGVLALCVISPGGSLVSLAIALSPVCLQNSGRLTEFHGDSCRQASSTQPSVRQSESAKRHVLSHG
jgi:hypothetical protein